MISCDAEFLRVIFAGYDPQKKFPAKNISRKNILHKNLLHCGNYTYKHHKEILVAAIYLKRLFRSETKR